MGFFACLFRAGVGFEMVERLLEYEFRRLVVWCLSAVLYG